MNKSMIIGDVKPIKMEINSFVQKTNRKVLIGERKDYPSITFIDITGDLVIEVTDKEGKQYEITASNILVSNK